MKSMTDFIMEQEAPQVVEEAFNENELVSNFMGVCAASANLTCVLECASIVEFCTANEISVPSIIQESWADFWTGVKNFFKKIADWFKSLVKGTTTAFAKATLQKIIAKLSTFDSKEPVDASIYDLACYAAYVPAVLEKFRETYEKITDTYADGDVDSINAALDNMVEFTNATKDLNKLFNSKGEVKVGNQLDTFNTAAGITAGKPKSGIAKNAYTIENLLTDLKFINELDIPGTGTKILKAFEVNDNKIQALTKTQTKLDDKGDPVKDKATGKDVTETVTVKDSSKVQKIVKDSADAVAKFYDKIKGNMVKLTDLAYKDSEVDADKKKDYDKELERANKDANHTDLRRGHAVGS